jgi:hypothetical protein
MDYIKLYEEFHGYSDEAMFRKELNAFCNEELQFLITDGFEVFVGEQFKDKEEDEDSVMITLRNDDTFKWIDVKTSFLKFYSNLSDKYNVSNLLVFQIFDGMDYDNVKVNVEDIDASDVINYEVISVKFQVEY